MRVLIACQAGKGVGLGHLSRCLVIGKALSTKFGAEVSYLIQSEPMQRSDLDSCSHTFISPSHDLSKNILTAESADLVILDLQAQRVTSSLKVVIRSLRDSGVKVVAVDGLRDLRSDLDLIFIPSFRYAASLEVEYGAPVVFGWDCFLLDEAPKPLEWAPGKRVLVLTGGSDATHLGATWPELLDKTLSADVVVNWVTGPFASHPKLPKQQRVKIVEHVAPEGLGALMRETDYAITVFGVSFFELLYFGVPTIVFSPYGGKDSAELAAVSDAGVAIVAGDEKGATEKLYALMEDDDCASRLSLRAKEHLSVSGADRFCSEVAQLFI